MAYQVEIAGFDVPAGHDHVGGHEVDVQLQGISTGVLHHLRIANPTAAAGAVEAGNDRHAQRFLGFLDGFKVLLRAGVIVGRLGIPGGVLRIGFGPALPGFLQLGALELDLLLE